MATTKIEWATHTSNHQAGCNKVSPACTFCYALTLSVRLANMGQQNYKGVTNGDLKNPKWTGVLNFDEEKMKKNFQNIRKATKPRRTFYGSMTDLFHESLDIKGKELKGLAQEVAKLRKYCKVPQVVMFLTKRPQKLLEWQQYYFPNGLPDQIWVGVTAESQKWADIRIPFLVQIKAKVHYLSCEPMFGHIQLSSDWLPNLEWVIAGGESGFKARVADPQWFRSLRDQSRQAGIPFHFKQWGEWNDQMKRVGKKKAGRILDGQTHDDFPKETV